MDIIGLLQAIAAPLSSEIILAAIVAGLFFGAFYNHKLNLPRSFIYHKLVSGLGFIGFMFLFRAMSGVLTAGAVANPAGWLGVALLWVIFCGFIWLGDKSRTKER